MNNNLATNHQPKPADRRRQPKMKERELDKDNNSLVYDFSSCNNLAFIL
jgi:hypothetical protein